MSRYSGAAALAMAVAVGVSGIAAQSSDKGPAAVAAHKAAAATAAGQEFSDLKTSSCGERQRAAAPAAPAARTLGRRLN